MSALLEAVDRAKQQTQENSTAARKGLRFNVRKYCSICCGVGFGLLAFFFGLMKPLEKK